VKPKHKFNNGEGATLCNKCSVIISEGLTEALFCNTCIDNMVDVDTLEVVYSQKADDMDDNGDYQELRICAVDGGAGAYFYISTNRWAVDSLDDLKKLFTKFEKAYKLLNNENTTV
jgi:hypothetical protein